MEVDEASSGGGEAEEASSTAKEDWRKTTRCSSWTSATWSPSSKLLRSA